MEPARTRRDEKHCISVKEGGKITKADLSAKTDSATSFALHVLLSLDFKNNALGGPI